MPTLRTLKQDARETATWRGHSLSNFRAFDLDGPAAFAECCNCKAWVQVETHPAPNSIDIGGPALGLNCGDVLA